MSKEEQNIVEPKSLSNKAVKRSHSVSDSDDEEKSSDESVEPKRKVLKKVDSSELPTIFDDKVFFLSDKVFKKDQLKRYIIA